MYVKVTSHTMNKEKLENFLHSIVNLKYDSIHTYNSNGADWHTCRLCYASKDEIRGVYQEIEHSSDCPGVIAQELLDELDKEE